MIDCYGALFLAYRLNQRLIQDYAKEDHKEDNHEEVILDQRLEHFHCSSTLYYSQLTVTGLKESLILIQTKQRLIHFQSTAPILHVLPHPVCNLNMHHHGIFLFCHIVSHDVVFHEIVGAIHLRMHCCTVVVSSYKCNCIVIDHLERVLYQVP